MSGSVRRATDNVITYKDHLLQLNNDDLALRPGMTATAPIMTACRENALLVPNTALRFMPPEAAATKQNGSLLDRLLPRPPELLKTHLKVANGNQAAGLRCRVPTAPSRRCRNDRRQRWVLHRKSWGAT